MMDRFGTDAMAITMIVAGAVVATGATVLLAAGGEPDLAVSECAADASRDGRVVVTLGEGDRSIVVAPGVEGSVDAECAPSLHVTRLHVVKAPEAPVVDVERAVAERARRDARSATERAERALAREMAQVERERASADRERARVQRDRARAERDRARVERDRARAERDRSRAERPDRVERAELVERVREEARRARETGVRVQRMRIDPDRDVEFEFEHDFDFEGDFDFDFDFDFDVDDFDVDVKFDAETMHLRIEGLEDMGVDLGDFQVDLSGIDADSREELQQRLEERMRDLERRLTERRRGGS